MKGLSAMTMIESSLVSVWYWPCGLKLMSKSLDKDN